MAGIPPQFLKAAAQKRLAGNMSGKKKKDNEHPKPGAKPGMMRVVADSDGDYMKA